MQNTLPLTPGNPLRNVTGLARQIALPGEHAPLRFPSFPALERTAVMGFNQPVTLSLPALTPVGITVFRQACFPVWADSASVGCYGATWKSVGDSTIGIATEQYIPIPVHPDSIISANRSATASLVGINGSNTVAPSFIPLGKDTEMGDGEWMYHAGGSFGVVVHGNVAALNFTLVDVVLDFWISPGEAVQIPFSMDLLGGNLGVALTFSALGIQTGWYRPRSLRVSTLGAQNLLTLSVTLASFFGPLSGLLAYTPSVTTAGVLVASGASTRLAHIPLVTPTEFGNSRLPWFATRVTAAAMLGTNVSQVLNKGGTVLAGRLSPAVVNAFTAIESNVTNLHPAEKAYLPLETGVYTYCPPSTDLVFFSDYSSVAGQFAPSQPLFILSNDSMYNKMFVTASAVAETLACTVTWHIEFRTSSALFQIGLSAMTLESLHQAQLVLSESGYFFENPDHKPLLNRIIATAKKYAPDVVGSLNPVAGRMLQSVLSRTLIPRDGPKNPKTTSAAASGMVGKKAPKAKKPKVVPKKGKKKK